MFFTKSSWNANKKVFDFLDSSIFSVFLLEHVCDGNNGDYHRDNYMVDSLQCNFCEDSSGDSEIWWFFYCD